MKRLNPSTGQPFVRGDAREEDDYLFFKYQKQIKISGYYREHWYQKEKFEIAVKKNSDLRRDYERKNPQKHRARNSKSQAERLKRKPKWIKDVFLEEIKEIYSMAHELEKVFPWKMHVDHRIPKQGKLVSGLHVPWNLEIIPWIENIKKGNKYVDESDAPSLSEGYYIKGKVYTTTGTIPAPWIRENNNNPNNYIGTISGQDIDYRAQEGGRDRVGHRGQEVGTPKAFEGKQNHGFTQLSFDWT